MPLSTATGPAFGPPKQQLSKMMDQLSKGFYSFCPTQAWVPSVNLYETETSYLVCVDLAGVVKEEIDIQIVNQHLVLKGSRPVPVRSPKDHPSGAPDDAQPRYRVHLMEIDHGVFCRDVELPEDVAHDRISAAYRNGLLWIELPKKS